MKITLFLTTLILLCTGLYGRAALTTVNIKTTFGAKGNGKTNDMEAFRKASKYINARGGNCVLTIPKGVYIVGDQRSVPGKHRMWGENVIALDHCTNVEIKGALGSEIRFANNMYFGSFDEKMQPYEPKMPFYKNDYACHIGNMIHIMECEGIRISGLHLNGNSDTYKLGGLWGDTGRQLICDGVNIFNSTSIVIDRIRSDNFGRDGLMIGNDTKLKTNNQIKVQHSTFHRNGRQGCSIIGGIGMVFENCTFSSTGTGRIYSAPGAGVDIEAEDRINRNIRFRKCRLQFNKGCQFVADSGDSEDIEMEDCVFIGMDNWSIWNDKPKVRFRGSKIYGSVVHCCRSDNAEDGTVYENCYFADTIVNGKMSFGNFLMEINSAKNLQVRNCVFHAKNKKAMWLEGSRKDPTSKWPMVENCTLVMDQSKIPAGDYYFVARLVQYKNNKFFVQEKRENKAGRSFVIDGSLDLGGNQFEFIGQSKVLKTKK